MTTHYSIWVNVTTLNGAQKHGFTAAQVAIAWLLDQSGVIATPKAGRPESQRANLDALNIKLDDEYRQANAGLPKICAMLSRLSHRTGKQAPDRAQRPHAYEG